MSALCLLTACGGGGGGGNTSQVSKFTGAWVLAAGPAVSCPGTPGVLTAIDAFQIVAGTDYPLVLDLTQGQRVCALDFGLTNLTATLARNQNCTFDFDVGTADVTFKSGELGGAADGSHLNISLGGSVTLNSEGCSYSYAGTATR